MASSTLVSSALVSGCGDDSVPTEPAEAIASAASPLAATVRASADGLHANVTTVRVGDRVEFVNADSVVRSFQGRSGDVLEFDSGDQGPGDRYTWRASAPGEVEVTDRHLASAVLTIVVEDTATT